MRHVAIARTAFTVCAAAVAWLLLDPAPPGASVASRPGFDLLVHAALFAALAILLAPARLAPDARWAIAGLALFGGALELAQALVPPRSPSLLDLLADTAGALAYLPAARLAR